MAWVKVDDQFFRNPKVMTAGRDARDLYLVGLCYCAQSLTDGFIPGAALRVLAAEAEIDTATASAARLIDTGLWEAAEGGYMVHDYLEYQPSKDRVLETREARSEAGRRGGKQKASNLLDKTLAKNKQNSTPYPSRTHPVPLPNPIPEPPPKDAEVTPAQSRAKRATRIPDDFPLTDEMRDWLHENRPDLDPDRAHKEFCSYWRGEAKTKIDWRQTWENGMFKSRMSRPNTPATFNGQRSNAQAREDELMTNVYAFNPPERKAR